LRKLFLIITGVAITLGGILTYQAWLQNLPQWVLVVTNEPKGMDIRMVTTHSDEPFCEVRVQGQKFDAAPLRIVATAAENTKIEGLTTIALDSKYGPGHWHVRIDGVDLDVTPTRSIINGASYGPGADVILALKKGRLSVQAASQP
jgi:hypothetical protein